MVVDSLRCVRRCVARRVNSIISSVAYAVDIKAYPPRALIIVCSGNSPQRRRSSLPDFGFVTRPDACKQHMTTSCGGQGVWAALSRLRSGVNSPSACVSVDIPSWPGVMKRNVTEILLRGRNSFLRRTAATQ